MKTPFPTRKLTSAGLLLALAVLLPAVVHMTSLAGGGKVLLPMHLPVLFGGFLLGPVGGALLGLVSPALSFLLIGMPTAALLPYQTCELVGYGFMAGLLFHFLRGRKGGIPLTLVGAMLFGRFLNAAALLTASELFGQAVTVTAVVAAAVTGALGILIQLIVLPPVVYAIERSGYFDT